VEEGTDPDSGAFGSLIPQIFQPGHSRLCFAQTAFTIRAVKINFSPRTGLLMVFIVLAVLTAHTAGGSGEIGLKPLAEGFTSPLNLVPLDDGSGRLLIVDQVGTIHVMNPHGAVSDKLFLDLRGRLAKLNEGFDERGLLGIALHPGFKQNHKLYLYYSAPLRKEAPAGWDHTSHLSEFKVMANDPGQVDTASERILLQIDEPQFNHNGGRLVFGPDGYLYIGVGDGGAANDEALGHSPQGNGQDLTTLLGKILRIDVNQGIPYGIPADNPFADGKKGRPEIYAYGFRNPWGISFDRGGKHELFTADVGQDAFEEVNLVVKGGNYGWRVREGFHWFDPKTPTKAPTSGPTTGPDGKPFVDPILEYKNFKAFPKDPESKGTSVTGGYVYRGKALPQLQGKYVFADWSQTWALPRGVLFAASPPGGGGGKTWSLETLKVAGQTKPYLDAYIVALAEDAEGELYVLTSARNALMGKFGKVHKLVPL
jgi:glucose/arabinose dehydrogenase